MALAIALLLLSLSLASSQSDYGYLNVDCGAKESYIDSTTNITWTTDALFINARCGHRQKINESLVTDPMNSLRVFPDQTKNCYTMPAFNQEKYLIRAGFFYGNYDNMSHPPVFDLQFDASPWTEVVTSMDKRPVFYEAVVVARRQNVSVCVSRTRETDTPFMSSVEMMQLLPEMYSGVGSDRALFKELRVSFGSNEAVRFPDDKYGRIWEPAQTAGYNNITADFKSLLSTPPEDPPITAIQTAIQATSPSDPITLSFNITQPDRPTYVALYFTEAVKLKPDENRTFDVYLNGQDYKLKVSPSYQRCSEIRGNADPSAGPFNLKLASSQNSNVPPIISAMELYTVSDVVPNGTALEDVFGLEWVNHVSDSLARWSGDPCLPVAWDWLNCSKADPPRVTSLYLGNYDIRYLHDFSQMQALETIDLQSNNITGTIPDFLGNFPNLRELNLANNKLRGNVPESLINDKLSLNISGNPELETPVRKKKKKKNIGLIVGVVVAAVVINCVVIAYFCWWNRSKEEINTVELSRVQVAEDANPAMPNETIVQDGNIRDLSAATNV